MNGRAKERVKRLTAAREQLISRRKSMSVIERNTGRGRRLKKKLVEYEESLNNLAAYGSERAPDGLPAGANIGIPHAGDKI